MSAPIRVIQVGCGDIAATGHLPAFARSAEFDLVGVADPDEDNRNRTAASYGVPAASDYRELLHLEPSAAVIAVPPHLAPRLSISCLDDGLDVLCEKPMAVDLSSAEEVVARAKVSDRIVQIGFKNRFSPLVRQVRTWIDQGRLGSPLAFTLAGYDESHDPLDPVHTGRILNFLDHGSSFIHEGAHFADYLAYLGAIDPISIQAVGLRSRDELPSDNFVAALARFADGSVARLEIGWQFASSPRGDFRVMGPQGVAIVDRPGLSATLRCLDGGHLVEETVELERPWNDACFDLQLAHFAECIRTRRSPEVSALDGLRSLRFGLAVDAATRNDADHARDDDGTTEETA